MPLQIVRYESTPNPNALKIWLNESISDVPRSFLGRDHAGGERLAESLFNEAGATTLLFCGEWMTFNKSPDDNWPAVKRRIEAVLTSYEHRRGGEGEGGNEGDATT